MRAEVLQHGRILTVGNISTGKSAMPLFMPGSGVAIVTLGWAWWVWDVERGKGERRVSVMLDVLRIRLSNL
jgi:hypothetical protein